MVDKKKEVKVVKNQTSKSSKPKETKEAVFLRVATPRVQKILKAYRVLSNCSNRNNYAYSQEQIDKIYTTLQESLDNMIYKFTPSKKEQEKFEF